MALRQTAHEVDLRQAEMGTLLSGPPQGVGPAEARERILIHVEKSPATSGLIRRGRRVADYLKADCFAVAVVSDKTKPPHKASIEEHMAFARSLHVETRLLNAADAAPAVVDFARQHAITQIFVAKPEGRPLPFLFAADAAIRIVELAKDMQVMVVARRGPAPRDSRGDE